MAQMVRTALDHDEPSSLGGNLYDHRPEWGDEVDSGVAAAMTRRTHKVKAALSEELERVLGMRFVEVNLLNGLPMFSHPTRVIGFLFIRPGQTLGEALKAAKGKR